MARPDYQGRFIWQELLCNDLTAATFFYSRVMQWKAQPFSPGSPYLMFTAVDGRSVAGAMRLSDEARAAGTTPYWRGYIGTEDIDATVALAASLGARVVQPAQDVPTVGRVALLADPEGATFGLFRPLPTAAPNDSGHKGFAWYELAARNRQSALAFYQRLFGWELRAPMDMGGGFHYQVFGIGAQDIGGAYTIPAERAMPPAWCPYATGASADETADQVLAAGGQVIHGPIDVPGGGRIVQFFDSQHALCAVHSMGSAVLQPREARPSTTAASVEVGRSHGVRRSQTALRSKDTAARAAKRGKKMTDDDTTMTAPEATAAAPLVRPRRKKRIVRRAKRKVRRAKRKVARKAKAAVRRRAALKSKLPGRRRRAARRIKRAKRKAKRKVVRVVRRLARRVRRVRRRAARRAKR
jgi:predicted enzyme related to lactoylglutathione lyase